ALADGDRSELGRGVVVAGNYFTVLGARPGRGRLLVQSDDDARAPSAAVISDAFWRRFFRGDPDALGRSLLIDGKPVTIVGITEPGFHGTRVGTPDVWIPVQVWPRVAPQAFASVTPEMRNWGWLHMVGRVRKGASVAQVRAALVAVATAQRAAHPEDRVFPELFQPISSAQAATGFEGH